MTPREADPQVVAVVGGVMGDLLGSGRPLGPEDGFFGHGGDSVRAVQVVARLLERFAPGPQTRASGLRAQLLVAIFDGAGPAVLASILQGGAGGC